jgi:hypothetical protein
MLSLYPSLIIQGSCDGVLEQIYFKESQFPSELILYLPNNCIYSLCFLGRCCTEGFSNLSKGGLNYYAQGLHFGVAAVTYASQKQYGFHFGAHFSGDDLIYKASDFHRMAKIGHSLQQGIFFYPVLIVQCEYLVTSVFLRSKENTVV